MDLLKGKFLIVFFLSQFFPDPLYSPNFISFFFFWKQNQEV